MAKTAVVHSQQRWEYVCLSKRRETTLAEEMTKLGASGWELVSVICGKDPKGETAWTGFLKRPAVHHAPQGAAGQKAAAAQPQASRRPAKTEPADALEGFDLSGDEFDIREEPPEEEKAEGEQ